MMRLDGPIEREHECETHAEEGSLGVTATFHDERDGWLCAQCFWGLRHPFRYPMESDAVGQH